MYDDNKPKYCIDCFYYEIKCGLGRYCNYHHKEINKNSDGWLEKACNNFALAVYAEVDVSGTGYESEILNRLTGEQYGVRGTIKLLNKLYYENQRLNVHVEALETIASLPKTTDEERLLYTIKELEKEVEFRKDYQRGLEDKIRRQKDMIRRLEGK